MSDSTVMSRERWERIQELFNGASEIIASGRAAWLAEQCGDDVELRDRVAALLDANADGDDDPERPERPERLERQLDQAIAGTLIELDVVQPGRMIGRYRVARLLGRGGMGAVYLAERADQQFEQQVALKLIGQSLPGSALARRFRAERQILAHLNHPNIARLLDGGAGDDGVPYLAMEYVAGTRIDLYCEQQQLDIDARLKLFQQVCAAVQYAHQNLVVHRDIKPSNILVTADGTPKLLDFGIAKLLDPQQTGSMDGLTRIHERVLTPEHASPEQVRGEPVGTVSDVYSLGVLLYELLTGQRPYATLGQTLQEMERAILEVTPLKPSTAVERKERDNAGLRALRRTLAGDLDNIVLRAMHKEPARRYASAAALAEDIQRYLDDRPVQARPDDWLYRASKFLRRNLLPVVTTAAVGLLIAILVAFYTVRLAAERDRAAIEAAKSAQVADFLTDIFRVADPMQAQGRQVTALELLDRGAQDIDAQLADQPLVRADLLFAIGLSYKNLSAYDRAGPLLEQSLAIKSAAGLESTREYAQTLYELANLRRFQGRFDESEQHFKRTLEIQQRIFAGPDKDTAATLTHLAVLYYEMKRPRESLGMQEQALAMTRAVFGEQHVETANRMNNLALVLQDLDRHAEAEQHLRNAIRIQADALGERHPDVLVTRYNLGLLLRNTGRYREAEALLRELLPLRRIVLGDAHPSVGLTLSALGGVLMSLNQLDESERVLNEALQLLTHKLGETHWRTGGVLRQLGQLSLIRGHHEQAEQLLRRALDVDVRTYGESSAAAYQTRTMLAAALIGQQDIAKAEELLEASHEQLRALSGIDSSVMNRTLEELGKLRVRQQRYDEAAALFKQAVSNYERVGGPRHPDASDALLGLAEVALHKHDTSLAISISERALANLAEQLPADHWRIVRAKTMLSRSRAADPGEPRQTVK